MHLFILMSPKHVHAEVQEIKRTAVTWTENFRDRRNEAWANINFGVHCKLKTVEPTISNVTKHPRFRDLRRFFSWNKNKNLPTDLLQLNQGLVGVHGSLVEKHCYGEAAQSKTVAHAVQEAAQPQIISACRHQAVLQHLIITNPLNQ